MPELGLHSGGGLFNFNDMKEVWKTIEGYNGAYEVSNTGKIRSWKRSKDNPKILSPTKSNYGHLLVTLFKDSVRHRKCVHRLIAKAFILNPENKPQINHIDSDPANNSLENLEWTTQSENIQHAFDTGRKTVLKGSDVKTSKLTREDVLDIRNAKRLGCFTNQELGDAYGVSAAYISVLVNRKRWKHV